VTFYLGRYAELYDLLYWEKPYAVEARFVLDRLEHFAGSRPKRAIEIACGTGTHAIELARAFVEIDASDCSADMLRVATKKVEAANVPVRLSLSDMRGLPKPEQPYDAALCLFDSIGYVQSDEAICDVLSGVRASLDPGALFLLEYWHAAAMLRGFDPLRIRRLELDDTTIFRVSTTTIDAATSLARVRYDLYELNADRTWAHYSETHSNRFFTVQEMNTFAARNGFEPLDEYSGFTTAPVNDDTWHVVAVWRRR
jgi:SAM-dependent methyltransferase